MPLSHSFPDTPRPQSVSFELSEFRDLDANMDPTMRDQAHEPLLSHGQNNDETGINDSNEHIPRREGEEDDEEPFSRVIYFIFLLLGVAMLWSWNMFLAAVPYFQRRFESNPWILNHFQPAQVSVATLTSLVAILILSAQQQAASYPRRIVLSLIINSVLFVVLAVSTFTTETSAASYFGFLLLVVFVANIATALIQNGGFAFTARFGGRRREYTQAIMTGQGVGGVLPSLAQIITVIVVSGTEPDRDDGHGGDEHVQSPRSAFIYFITAAAVSGGTLIAFFDLLRRKAKLETARTGDGIKTHDGEATNGKPKPLSLAQSFIKVPYLASAVVICFTVTLASFPVMTAVIRSVNGIDSAIFIPLAFLIWNIGDLLGRLSTVFPQLLLTHYPFALFCLAMARLIFIALYFLCNIKGRGAIVDSDFFYLVVVQLLFGLTNGYIGSSCMMGAGDWVAPDEREAVGAFMALCIIVGLAIGSLVSFAFGDV